jgi:hypothetical protein
MGPRTSQLLNLAFKLQMSQLKIRVNLMFLLLNVQQFYQITDTVIHTNYKGSQGVKQKICWFANVFETLDTASEP